MSAAPPSPSPTPPNTARTRTWFNPGFSWTAGTAVSIRIPDTTPPELTSAAVAADGNSITVTFDESVDQTNLPAAGAFSVAADGAPVTVSGVSAGTAAQLVLALAAPGIRAGQVVTLGYTDPTDGDDTSAVQDTSGNDAVSFSDYSVTNNSIVVTVPSDWSLKPTGLAVGAKFRLLFLSSTKRDGSSSDIADYHAFIQTRAAAGHADIRTYSTGFRALGCTSDVDARDTTYTTYTSTDKGVPIYWLNGAKAADQYEDFYDGTWDDEVNDKNESGTNGPNTSLEANYPLTGCNDRGTEYFDRFNRSSALAKIEVMVGRPNSSAAASHGPLSSNTALDVSNTVTRPMYGLSAIFQVAADTTPPTLTSADVEITDALIINLVFSEDLQLSNPPAFPPSLSLWTAVPLRSPASLCRGAYCHRTSSGSNFRLPSARARPSSSPTPTPRRQRHRRHPGHRRQRRRHLHHRHERRPRRHQQLHRRQRGPRGLEPHAHRPGRRRQVPAAVPLLHQARRHRHGYRDLQHLHTDPRRGRPHRHPSLQRGLQGGRLHRRHRRPRQHRDHVHQHRQGRPHLLAQRRQGRRRVRGFLRRVLGRRGQRQERVRHRRARYLPDRQLALDRLQPRRHRGAPFAGAVSRGLGTTVGIPNEVRYGRPDSSTVDHGPLNGLQNGPKAENRPLYGLSALFQVAAAVVVNNPATGAPTITGTAQVGQTLTAVTTGIMDDDGLNNVSYTYQWIRTATGTGVDTNISGATASTYTLVAADLGTTIKVRVSFTDDASNAETLTSAATAAVSAVVPSNWTLKPTAVAAGAKFRLLFLSSTRRNASSTDIATYNTFIQTRAANGHADIRDYSAGFRAVGCTAAVDARDNTATTYTTSDKGVPIYWLNGAKAADQYEDFYDGSWDDEANDKNESGTNGLDTSLNENWPLTGCDHDGTAHAALGASQVTRGRPNSSGSGHGPLNGNDQITSGLTSPLYGLSAIFQVAAAVVVPNNPPAFSADTAARSVAENTAAGQNVGAALTATDADSDTLTYTLEGTDAASFDIVSGSGQIRTRTGVTYNHEAKSTHTVVVKADDGKGGTDTVTVTITVTDVNEPPGRPAAPSVTATAGSSTSLDVSWTAPTNTGPAIASYDLQYREGTSGSFTAGPQDETGTSAAIASLMASTSHQVQVRATNAEGDGDWSFAGTGRTGNHAPAFSADTAARSVAENTAAGQNVGAALTATDADSDTLTYTLEGTDAASFDIVSGSGQIRTRTGVTYNHEAKSTHTVVVKADDGKGGTDTVTVTITVTDVNEPPGRPAAPSVTATAGSSTSLDVSWTAPTNTGPAIASYDLQYREGTSGSFTAGPQDETGTSAAIASLMASTSHQVQVRATNAEGDGDWSFAGTGRTGNHAPAFSADTAARSVAENTAAGQNVGAALTATDADSDTLTYTLEGADAASFDIVSGSGQIRTRTGVTYNHEAKSTHTVVVKADDGNGGTDTVTVTITVTDVDEPPGQPAAPSVSATAGSITSLDVTWTAPTNTGPAIASYDLQYREGTSGNFTNGPQNVTGTSAAIGSLAADTSYEVQVRATNAEGDGDWSVAGTGRTTATSVPGAPTGLTATASGTTAIDLSWSAPASTGGSAITGYKIEVSSDGGSSWSDLVANTSNTTTTYAHTGLTAGATRHYRVSAINANGTGTASNVASATTGTTVPGAPTGLSATASGTTAINLSWSAPASTGGSAITGYKIEVSSDGGSSWSDLVANTSNTTTTYAHTGLTAGATRHYRVSAINANGTGVPSNVANATTGQTTVTFGASSYTAAEGGATATVAVQLSAAASATVTIPLTKTHRGGATAADYSGVPSNVTFTAGQTRRTFTVTATDDADKDGGESVQLGFGTLPGGYAPGARRTATVTLVDDDATLIVNFGTERHTTVKVRESDTVWHRFIFSLSTSRYGPPNGNPQQPVTIPLVVTHRGGATPADYEVRGRRTLTSVTFGVGESVTSFSMRAIPDGRRETGEGLRLDFGRLPAGVRKGTWGPYETIAFVDQVLPGYTVLFGAEAYTATEGGAPARVSIHLSEPVEIEPLVVRLVVTHVGATAADYTGIPKSVRFGVGEQTQTITVKATDDTDDDDGESVTLSFVNDPNGRVRVRTGPASATVALADNDGPRRVTVSFGAVTYTATEGGADARCDPWNWTRRPAAR